MNNSTCPYKVCNPLCVCMLWARAKLAQVKVQKQKLLESFNLQLQCSCRMATRYNNTSWASTLHVWLDTLTQQSCYLNQLCHNSLSLWKWMPTASYAVNDYHLDGLTQMNACLEALQNYKPTFSFFGGNQVIACYSLITQKLSVVCYASLAPTSHTSPAFIAWRLESESGGNKACTNECRDKITNHWLPPLSMVRMSPARLCTQWYIRRG